MFVGLPLHPDPFSFYTFSSLIAEHKSMGDSFSRTLITSQTSY